MLSPKGQRNEELMGMRKCHPLTLETNTPQCIFSAQHEFQKFKFLLYTELEMKLTGERQLERVVLFNRSNTQIVNKKRWFYILLQGEKLTNFPNFMCTRKTFYKSIHSNVFLVKKN